MSQATQLGSALLEIGDRWILGSDLGAAADVDSKLVSALIVYLKKLGMVESRIAAASRECEYRVTDQERLAAYVDRTTAGKRGRPSPPSAAPTTLPDDGDGEDADESSAPLIHHSSSSDEVPQMATLASSLAALPSQPADPAPVTESRATARALTWAIDHRGKLILCFGKDAAYELQPPQWAPLARFLEPLAGVFA